jgi:hypothetical protein
LQAARVEVAARRSGCAIDVWSRCLGIALLLAIASQTAMADNLRVRIAWGGNASRLWQGTISVSDGSLSQPQPLGVEADEPGSMWLDGSPRGAAAKLVIRQRSPRSYDGVDVLVSAPASAKLLVQLSADGDSAQSAAIEIPLADLSGEPISKDLDNQGTRLLAMQSPGDCLRVSASRDSLVFAPGETFKFILEAHGLPVPKGSNAQIKVQLLGSGGKELSTQQRDVQADRAEAIPLEVVLPKDEGVYDVVITAANPLNWSQAVRQPLNWKRTIAERRVQLLVLQPQRPAAPRADREFAQIVEIDPANPKWFEKLNEKLNRLPQLQLAKARLPRLWKGPLGNDCLQSRRHALGDLAQLSPNADSPDVSWEAYWLPISQPGRPHILEVDYPSDVPQTLGLSIVEPTAAGAMADIGVDMGVDNAGEAVESAAAPHMQRHRLVFWPHTTTPLLLVTNGRNRAPAVYGKIRVLSGGERLPRAIADRPAANRRLLAAYLDRPLIPENVSAGECLDPGSGRSLNDWWTFYDGGRSTTAARGWSNTSTMPATTA